MAEKNLPVSESVSDAVLELHKRLQEVYGDDVTISDTIDYMGHHLFIYQQLLEIIKSELDRLRDQPQCDIGAMKGLLDFVQSLARNKDATCFVRSNVDVPFHWIHTRWLFDIQGKNIFKCMLEPEEESKSKAKSEYKIDVS
ncbi:MAG: hypothetical protein LUQ38_06225 [Methanotrichaceae archaeon]|nr:hypothetical protein [Methanotrichaceae archaeon]